jgi:hypothetical protein
MPAPIGFIWTRKSSKHDKTIITLDVQLDACLEQAKKDGVVVPPENIYKVRYSGVDLFAIPELNELKRRIAADPTQPKIVYAYVQDRLIRGEVGPDIFEITGPFRRANAKIFLVHTGVEITSGDFASHIMTLVRGEKAASEVGDIARRSWDGRLRRMQDGRAPMAGPEKYGWRRNRETGKAEIIEVQAITVRRVAEMYEAGFGAFTIGQRLSDAGIPGPKGGRWNASTVRRFFEDPAYKGESYGWRYGRKKGGPIQHRDPKDWVKLADDAYPAIIDPVRWDRINQLIEKNSGDKSRNEKHFALLRGLVFCASCGGRCEYRFTRGRKPGVKYWYYRCTVPERASRRRETHNCKARATTASDMEREVWEWTLQQLKDPESLLAIIRANWPAQDRRGADDLVALEHAAKGKAAEIARLAKRLRTATDSIAKHIMREMDDAEAEGNALKAQIAEAKARLTTAISREKELSDLASYMRPLARRAEKFPPDLQREVIERMQVRFLADGGKWDPVLR